MPARRSQCARPAASNSWAPTPTRGWNGVRLYVETRYFCSRATTASGDSSCSNKVSPSFSILQNRGVPVGTGNDDFVHSTLQRIEYCAELGAHTSGDDGALHQLAHAELVERLDHCAVLVLHSFDVGHEDELLRTERRSDCRGDC